MDKHKGHILTIFKKTYGDQDAYIWFQRWRLFYIAVAEMFNYNEGQEWFVVHYLFKRRLE